LPIGTIEPIENTALTSRDSHRANWVRHTAAPRVFQRVASALDAEGIPVLPVKGLLTAHVLYPDVAERPISDIDLRVPRRHFRRALAIARSHGWATASPPGPVLWQAVLNVDGWEVDVECTLGPPALCAITVDDMIQRARAAVEPFGFPHRQPEMNDHALVLALNAFKDGLHPTPWALEDLRRVVRHEHCDLERFVERTREGRVTSAIWMVADWLANAHGVIEWLTVRDRIGPRPPSARVARTYEFVQRRGWPPKSGLIATAVASDDLSRGVSGLALAAAGILRSRWVRGARVIRRAF
jgi:hypothetical protein